MVGTLPNGNSTTTCGGGTDTCPNIIWPGKSQTVDGLLTSHDPINQWWGSLITNKLDASGYKYMRNRYYNPATGHFTQQDPIGLAGGLNLYGFADGDPVNFSDPFGLCPICDIADIGFFVYSGIKAIGDPSRENLRDLALDAVGLLPIVPSVGMVRRLDAVRDAARGAKSAAEYDRHVRKTVEARGRLTELERELSRTKGPKAQAPLRQRIEELRREIKGHEKEIRQKWPEGRPQ